MLPYILFIAVMVFLHYKKWPGAMIVVMMLFAVMRYETGWDYHMYYSFSTESNYFLAMKRYSWFWQMLFTFGRAIAMPHVPIAITGVLIYTLLYIGLKWLYRSNSSGMADTLLIYTAWPFFYLTSFSTLRQCLAMSIVICIFACLNSRWGWKKKIPLLALMYYAAFVCHPSSLFTLILIPVYIFRKVLTLKLAMIAFGVAVLILLSLKQFLGILDIAEFNRYEQYLDMEDSYGGLISLLLWAIFAFLLAAGFMKKKRLLSSEFQQAYFLGLIGIGLSASVYSFLNTSVVSRMVGYMVFFMMFTIYPCASFFLGYRKIRPIVTAVMSALFLFYLVYTSGASSSVASSPYVPYRTILEQF